MQILNSIGQDLRGIHAGVVVGLLAMGESLPTNTSMRALRFLSWIVTIIGVSALANGKGLHAQI